MTVTEAQDDLRRAYVGGGPGVGMSALVWLAAGWVEQSRGIADAFIVLFFGGMLIFPGSTLVTRFVFRRAQQAKANPLGLTALESTVAMIGGLAAAWLFHPFQPEFVFPLAAIMVGTHYFVFKTVYGDPAFWILGALITAVGSWAILGPTPVPGGTIFAVAAIEAVFAVVLTRRALRP